MNSEGKLPSDMEKVLSLREDWRGSQQGNQSGKSTGEFRCGRDLPVLLLLLFLLLNTEEPLPALHLCSQGSTLLQLRGAFSLIQTHQFCQRSLLGSCLPVILLCILYYSHTFAIKYI